MWPFNTGDFTIEVNSFVGFTIVLMNGRFFYVNNKSFFFIGIYFLFHIHNNCRLLTINIVSFIFFNYRESKPPFCSHYEQSSPVNIVSRKIN